MNFIMNLITLFLSITWILKKFLSLSYIIHVLILESKTSVLNAGVGGGEYCL